MPCSMIHLIAAKKVNPKGSALYYLGNIAPDAVKDWHDKDITHLRNLKDREPTLISLAKKTDSDFAKGTLLHLYLDWKWDESVRQEFINDTGNDWFALYRNELSLAGAYAYHHTVWANEVWEEMDSLMLDSYGETPCASAADVKEFLNRNRIWHMTSSIGPSNAFTPELIDKFTTQAAKDFIVWEAINNLK